MWLGGSFVQKNEQLRKEALEEIYVILAEFYKYPTERFFDEVADGSIEDRLKELFKKAEYNYSNIFLKGQLANFQEMKKCYMHCFLGATNPYAPPIESVYKVWTTDPSVDMAMAKNKGYLFGDAALHVRHLFEHYRLEIPVEFSKMPDHLTLLLEFLSFMIASSSDSEVKQYLNDHFDWLDDFKKELSKVENSSFYLDITEIVIQAVRDELQWLEQKKILS